MSTQKTIAKAAGLMMAAIFLSRVLGLARDMIIAHKFGQGGLVSAYGAAFNVPDLLYFFLSSGALSSAFIPVFVHYLKEDKERDAWEVFSTVACFMAIVLGAIVILSEVFARPLVGVLATPGFRQKYPELLGATTDLTRIVLPSQLCFFFGGLMMGTLEARGRFTARALGPIIYNLGIIFGAVALSGRLHIAGLAWGALLGAFVGNVCFAYVSLRRAGYKFFPALNLRHPGVIKVAKLALPVMLGLSLPQIDVIINRWFASYLGESAIAALNNGNRLMQVPLGVFAQAAAVAFFPTLAAQAARREIGELRSSLNLALRGILFLTIPASVFLMVLSLPIIRTFYQSGAYKSADALYAAPALLFYAAGIFAWGGQAIVARGFYALQDTLTVIIAGTIMTAIFIPMNYGLMQVMGIGGLALATSIAATLHMFALIFLLRKRIGGIGAKRLAVSTGKILTGSAAIAAVCLFAQHAVGRHTDITTRLGAAQLVTIAGLASVVVYLGLMSLMRSDELRFFGSVVSSRLRRKRTAAEPQPADEAESIVTMEE